MKDFQRAQTLKGSQDFFFFKLFFLQIAATLSEDHVHLMPLHFTGRIPTDFSSEWIMFLCYKKPASRSKRRLLTAPLLLQRRNE